MKCAESAIFVQGRQQHIRGREHPRCEHQGLVNRRIRARTYGGVRGRGLAAPSPTRSAVRIAATIPDGTGGSRICPHGH